MWFLTEIEIETNLPYTKLLKMCIESKIKVSSTFGSDGKYLGERIDNDDYIKLRKQINEHRCNEKTINRTKCK